MSSRTPFRAERSIGIRSVLLHGLSIPPAPDLTQRTPAETTSMHQWVLDVWCIPQIATAVRHASPDLARRVDDLAERPAHAEGLRQLVLSLLAYVLRLTYRVTPFGHFAGIAEGQFGREASARWGEDHQLLTRAEGAWLAAVVQQLESMPDVRRHVRIMASNALRVRGERLVLPWQPRALDEKGTAVREVSVRHTAAVEAAVKMTAAAVPYGDVVDQLAAAFAELGAREAEKLLDLLISRRMLLTSLHPSGTDVDALGHVVQELGLAEDAAYGPAARLVSELREIHRQVCDLNRQRTPPQADQRRRSITKQMRQVVDRPSPLSVDVLMDAQVTVPRAVAWEAEAAAAVLARVTPEPDGTAAWTRYRKRFRDRYGDDVLVPVLDLLDPHTGLGPPEDYLGTARAPRPNTVKRDQFLMVLAQRAVAEGKDLVLDEDLIEELAGHRSAGTLTVPAHVELLGSIHARSMQALNAGEFTLQARRVGRSWGYFTGGRLAAVLARRNPPSELLDTLARRPTTVSGALPVQLSFPPLRPSALGMTRAPRMVAPLISLAEFRDSDCDVIPPDDLAVICDGQRLHLVSLSRRRILEPAIPHPLEIEVETPTIARFLDEMQRGQSSRLTGDIGHLTAWDWGAARDLAALPRVRSGRSVLSPATWRLAHAGLPGPAAGVNEWEEAFAAWRAAWRLPRHVYLEHWDTPLRLDLDHPAHRALLRSKTATPPSLGQHKLVEAEPADASGWCNGRRLEVVIAMSSKAPGLPAPAVRDAPLAGRDQAHLPGASSYVSARLYCQHLVRHALLVDHLPALAAILPHHSIWWLTPHDKDEPPYTELTIRLADTSRAAETMRALSQWAAPLVTDAVISDVALVPYRPHVGLWGSQKMLKAAELVWAADSRVLAYQHAHQHALASRPVLAAANILAIAGGFHQNVIKGMRWLSEEPKPHAAERLSETLLQQARELAAPDDHWAAIRRTRPGSTLVESHWAARNTALLELRAALSATPRSNGDDVLHAVLNTHLQLAGQSCGVAWRLARAVALARTQSHRRTP